MRIQIKNKLWQALFPVAILIAAGSIAYTSYLDHNYSVEQKDVDHTYQIHRKYGNPEYRYLSEQDGFLYSAANYILIFDIIIAMIGTLTVIMYERKRS